MSLGIAGFFGAIIVFAIVFFILSAVLFGLWNEILKEVFGTGILNEITFWQSCGVTLFLMLFITPKSYVYYHGGRNDTEYILDDYTEDLLEKYGYNSNNAEDNRSTSKSNRRSSVNNSKQ
jgi:hypothetical protein